MPYNLDSSTHKKLLSLSHALYLCSSVGVYAALCLEAWCVTAPSVSCNINSIIHLSYKKLLFPSHTLYLCSSMGVCSAVFSESMCHSSVSCNAKGIICCWKTCCCCESQFISPVRHFIGVSTWHTDDKGILYWGVGQSLFSARGLIINFSLFCWFWIRILLCIYISCMMHELFLKMFWKHYESYYESFSFQLRPTPIPFYTP